MSKIFGYDCDQLEELELKVVDVNGFITEEELASAVSASLLNGFLVTKQDDDNDEPCYVFQKETLYKEVEKNGAQFLTQLFPSNVCSKNTLKKLTRNVKGRGLEENSCLLGVEVYATDGQNYQACPKIKIAM